jgi:hypothetical protein
LKSIIIIFLSFFLINSATSQTKGTKDVYDKDKLFTLTDTLPKFPGNLTHYMDSVLMGEWLPDEGRVIVEVIIDTMGTAHYGYLYDHTNGDVSNLRLKRIINQMPDWIPAFQDQRHVNFKLILLFDFSDGKLIQVSDRNINKEIWYMVNSNKP